MAQEEKIILNADLYDNPLTTRKGDYVAKPRITGTLYNEEIAARFVNERSEFRPETIVNILDVCDQLKAKAIAEGKSVVDGVGEYLISIQGAFEGEAAQFDPEEHSLTVNYKMGKTLRDILENQVVVQTNGAATVGPVINNVEDTKTKSLNAQLSPNGVLVISGSNLKIAGDSEDNGVYFVPVSGGEPVKAEYIAINKPSQLVVQVPNLSDGKYQVRVTTQYSTGSVLTKLPRSFDYFVELQVGDSEDDSDGPSIS